ncbi:MAG TPA: XRE family transcriptional regulator [Ilumatobacteraceae bacterium]|nr:XRE family transcriptional regulator [Ilumatobacteraceae bacterium]
MTLDAPLDPIRAAVGVSIRRARQASGLSMRDFAARCGLSQPFVSAVERGMSTPSIATLYRMADVLGMAPSSLLPSHPTNDVDVIRADDGQLVPSSDRPGSAMGRVLLADPSRRLEIYEYVIDADDDLDVWYDHPGDVVLHLIEGRLRVELTGRPTVDLDPGDCLVHPGDVPHRWSMIGAEPVRLFLVIIRPS